MLKVACIQTNPGADYEKNLSKAFSFVAQAAEAGAQVVVLPEMFSFMGSLRNTSVMPASPLGLGAFLECQRIAQELGIYLVSGSHRETPLGMCDPTSEKFYNTCLTFDPQGNTVSIYRKLHLFKLVGASGEKIYDEEDSFLRGEAPNPYSIILPEGPSWTCVNIICYDLRFPETLRRLQTPFHILFVTAAFTWQTGKDHWEVLLRARAIENQCYVVACNQTGFYQNGDKRNYGHSLVVDPWGQVVAALGEEEGILYCNLDPQCLAATRDQLPALQDRCL